MDAVHFWIIVNQSNISEKNYVKIILVEDLKKTLKFVFESCRRRQK